MKINAASFAIPPPHILLYYSNGRKLPFPPSFLTKVAILRTCIGQETGISVTNNGAEPVAACETFRALFFVFRHLPFVFES